MEEWLLGVVGAEERGCWGDEGGEKRGNVGCWRREEGVKGVYYYEMSLTLLSVWEGGRGRRVWEWTGRTCCGGGAGYLLEFLR